MNLFDSVNYFSRSGRRATAYSRGFILPGVIAFILAATITAGAVLTVILTNLSVVGSDVRSQRAFNIAEAGINYYLWHLSHNGTDYRDGQATPASPVAGLGYGPYRHDYIDSDAVNEGTFTLYINPVSSGSTLVNVRSIGQANSGGATRTVQAQIGAASFASYGVVSDTSLWFGSNESALGPVHSNQGVRMDGPSADTITSANATYVPSNELGGDGAAHPGVWCNPSVTTPVNCNTRSKTAWQYPVPSVDFNQVSGSLCTMKKTAFADYSTTASLATQPTACSQVPTSRTNSYLPQRSTSYSASKGYLVQLNTNGTYDLFNVNAENDQATSYSSALTTTAIATGIAIPPSGVIFAEDNVWVRSNPTFHGRVTIAAGRLATSNNANITIADDIAYSTKNGSDVIGLVAESDIILAPYAPPSTGSFTFEVDAATLAQTGSVIYPSTYTSNTSRCTRGWTNTNQQLNFYGSVASRQTWTWNIQYGSSCGDNAYDSATGKYISGIERTTTQYDYNLLYAPPPSYPVTGGYNILSWREVLTHP